MQSLLAIAPKMHSLIALLGITAVFPTPQAPLTVNKHAWDAVPTPTVHLDDATFTGKIYHDTTQFLGIPYAEPPVEDLRFRPPKPVDKYVGDHNATEWGFSCPQQRIEIPGKKDPNLARNLDSAVDTMYEKDVPDNEDCLTINVVTPLNAGTTANLPVLVWIYGGAFEFGGTASYNGSSIVSRATEFETPIVFVSLNYRVNGFGFLASKEVKAAGVGNLGLEDQRLALRWVQKYISAFGGDPKKVTIWGQSAGAISVSLQMIMNGGDNEGLFRGGIMQSGGPIPVGDIEHGQIYYDDMVRKTGCENATDTLDCLRQVPYLKLKGAIDESPDIFAFQGLVLAWLPRVDGRVLTEPPQHSVLGGRVADVPFITGNCDDEGSMFSIRSSNLSTNVHVREFLHDYMAPQATKEELDLILHYYPSYPPAGCPFDTGFNNQIGPQYKRIAAIQGDFVFHGPRRMMLQSPARKEKAWSFLSKRSKSFWFIGSYHGHDLSNSFGKGEMRDYIIRFTVNLDPNGKVGLGIPWPIYEGENPRALVFQDNKLLRMKLETDGYRKEAIEFAGNLSLIHPI